MMFVFIFGRVMVSSGYMPPAYKSLLLPGIMAISMVFTGVWAVAMPLIAEFQFTREIEDRLLAPIEISWLAIEKVFFGAVQALLAGLAVIPDSMGAAAPGCGIESALATHFCLRNIAGGAFLGLRRPRARVQHQSDAHWPDVQHGFNSNDIFRLHLLSLERAGALSHSAENRANQSSRLRQRRPARNSCAAVPTFVDSRRLDRLSSF